MDYNDNDYEGQNLHLTGEESSKISVLRPFALPKFDFDDNLNGHLRFDSLVENEIFLGIPNQEDNHWIEDFSRGGNGIEFSSSAAESCALPRHINVWSEATSSESVEMLLKAVGQEEMVPGENIIEESDPGDQLGSPTRQMIINLREDYKVGDVDNPALTPAELEGKISKLNQSAGVEDDRTENTLQVEETTSNGVGDDTKDSSLTVTSGNSNHSMKRTNDNQGGTCGLVDESLINKKQEILPVLGKDTSNVESASQNIEVSVRESVDQDNISHISFVSSSHIAKGISNPVHEQNERCNENDARLSGIAVETYNIQKHCYHEIPSGLQSPKEHAVETCIANFGDSSNLLQMSEYISTNDECNKDAFVLEPANLNQHSTVAGTETKQLSEGHSTSHEKSSVTLQGEGIEGLGIRGSSDITSTLYGNSEMKQLPVIQSPHQHEKSSVALQGEGIEVLGIEGSDVVTPAIYGNSEKKQDSFIQSPDQNKIIVRNANLSPKDNRSLEASSAISDSSTLPEILGNPSEKNDDHSINHAADGTDNSRGSTVSGECSGEKSVTDDTKNAKYTAVIQKENVEDGGYNPPPLVAGSIQACTEDILSVQVDAPESNLTVSAHKKESEKLPPDSCKMVCDDISKEVELVRIERVTESQPHHSIGGFPVLNTAVEDTKLAASFVEGDDLVESRVHNLPSSDLGHRNQSKETAFEAPKTLNPSVPKEPIKSNELAPAIETEKGTMPCSAAGEIKTSRQSGSLLETSGVTIPDGACKDLNKKIEHSANALIAQDDPIEPALTKKPMEVETERTHGTSSAALSVTSCAVEIDKSNKVAVPGASCANLLQTEGNKQAPLKRNNSDNIDKVLKTSEISGVNDPPKEDGAFTFDIRPLGGHSTEDSGKDIQSFTRLQACKLSLTGEHVPSVSSSGLTDKIVMKETSNVSSSTPTLCPPSGGLGGPSERKSRRGGGSKSGKGSSKRGNLVKETSPLKQTEKGDKSSPFFSPLGTGQLMTFESCGKRRGAVSIPTSSLPDLNTSAPSSSFFRQPFTDLQQVQLRAQIFVYGSLIQGVSPDEACMVSAFDGGRSVWERSWQSCVDRLHGHKSQGNNTGTPGPSRPGVKASDQTNRQSFPQSEVLSSLTSWTCNKAIPSPVVNHLIPLSSPMWSISTPSDEALPPSSMSRGAVIDYQAVCPSNPYQTPPMRNYVAHTTWPAQVPPTSFPVSWLSSSQSSPFEISTSHPAFPILEPAKSTADKESSLPVSSGTIHISPIPANSITLPGTSLDPQKVKISTGQIGDTKTRKRKKSSGAKDVAQDSVTASLSATVSVHAVANQLSNEAPAVENLSQMSLITQNQVGSMSAPVVGSYYSTTIAVTAPSSSSFWPKSTTNQAFTVLLPSMSSHLNKGDLGTDKRALNIEGFSKVEEAKLQAQEAAVHAASALGQCEGVWSQLDQQKSSGLTSEAESKLASAAVAIAAAASVAKAAAAAAKIASNVASQAKQMADEAVTMSGTLGVTAYNSNLVYNYINLVNASPAAISKGGDRSNAPSLAISAAREASRKRIEAASAATKHAEILDAIVKAAELAAEAVAHTGKVVAMGDPFVLSALAEAGPNNYWKVLQVASLPGSKSNDINKSKSTINNAGEAPNVHTQHEGPDKDTRLTSHLVSPIQRGLSRNLDDHVILEENLIHSVKNGENSSEPATDSAKTTFVVPDPDIESRSNLLTASIEEGSHVEILKDLGDLKKAWVSATVLTLKDGEILVCYKGLRSGDGPEQQECIPVEAKDGDAPKVRIPHPLTSMQFEGTRKRSRAAVKDYTWSVGDRVDALVEDCWYEGIIAEKNKKDATTLSVHFPDQGETLKIKVWNLRPSLVWSDGQWIEWCKPMQNDTSQGDTPVEKRPKLGSTTIEAKVKTKISKNIDFAEIERNQERRLPLSANEKVFSIGSTRKENKPSMVRTMRSGFEREGSRVVFGVPRPGKKRKFMEVSKHYVSDRIVKTNAPNDSVKLAKFLMPQGPRSRGTKNCSKLDLKEKQVADSKPKVIKSGKPPSIPSRTLSRKDGSTSSRPNTRDASVSDHSEKGPISNDENGSSEQNLADVEEAPACTVVFSSQALPRENHKKAARNTKPEKLNQGKLAPAGGKSTNHEAAEKLVSEVAEPRRSNRRIQPTSRLLEGLQSSLIVSKIPSSSHDKGHRSFSKGPARGSNNRG